VPQWGGFIIYGLLGAAGTWVLVRIAEARDDHRANGTWGDFPNVPEGAKASSEKRQEP
jgi:hypothetical protein